MFLARVLLTSTVLAVGLFSFVQAATTDEPAHSGFRWFPGTAVFAVVVAAVHLLAPKIRRVLSNKEPIVASFGGGMAAAYVFVHLLPELSVL